jgi:outer membrane protein insertion porin family
LGLVILGLAGSPAARGAAPLTQVGKDLAADQFAGRTVEAVRVEGNTQVSTSVILELVRTREGDKFDPDTVIDDYQRIYDKMKMFANVEAFVQPTQTGVIVVFKVTEQKRIREIRYLGNVNIETDKLKSVVDLKPGEAIDNFRINLAKQSIEKLYRDKNYPSAHVIVSPQDLMNSDVVFQIVEGPQVRIRKVDFIGNNSFSTWRLKDQIKTGYYIFIIRPGVFDPEEVDEDVSRVQKYYYDHGFFDVRVGRKLSRSADMTEMEVTFLVDEGPRYYIDQVEFKGISAVSEGALRKEMKDLEGRAYDEDVIKGDIRAIVKVYSKVGGYIYDEHPGVAASPDYLQIRPDHFVEMSPGKVKLVYNVSEGKQFRVGRILVKGNTRTKDNVIQREMRIRPGQMYNSSEVEDATDRLRGLPYFTSVSIEPVGDDPESRDLVVEVAEQHTAQISAGIGINSNLGFGGQLSYEQKNFDVTNFPTSWDEAFSDRAFSGAGQDFLVSFEPGTEGTNALVSFTEPYLFDQPYSFNAQGYLSTRIREVYNDDRLGGRLTLGERFNYVYSADVFFRAEDVDIKDLTEPESVRAPEIVAGQGHHTLTSIGTDLRRDTTNHGPITYQGTLTTVGFEDGGAMGGTVSFDRVTFSFDDYLTVNEDLLGRRTVINTHVDAGWDPQSAPFYERFYGGGLGSVRGFLYRGISPRGGLGEDPVGGDFAVTGSVQYGFPLVEDFLRGVLFCDAGDVESNVHFGTIRTSVGFGFRLVLPFFGQTPLALDFGFPITHNSEDNEQVLSFSFGISR